MSDQTALRWSCLPFQQLTAVEIYEIMVLRQAVFVVEQNCAYLDADDRDQPSWHLMARDAQGALVAYTRLIPKGISYPDFVSIGRVVSAPQVRGTGAGRALMRKSIQMSSTLFGRESIKIGAQTYLLKFYESFGFVTTGEAYLEDGIPHTKMIFHWPQP